MNGYHYKIENDSVRVLNGNASAVLPKSSFDFGKTSQSPELGFSIKSQLGNSSTLLNASVPTNFVYKIVNADFCPSNIEQINSISTKSKIKDRVKAVAELGGSLEYLDVENSIFKNNLILIDSHLPQIMAEVVRVFYTSKLSTIKDIVKYLEDTNPLNYDTAHSHKFYEYKIKRLLTDTALGMMAATVWTGTYEATGGYLVVKENGDVLCYHIYNKNEFENYLFANTKLETASSDRHKFGSIYETKSGLFFKLNLQIRFMH